MFLGTSFGAIVDELKCIASVFTSSISPIVTGFTGLVLCTLALFVFVRCCRKRRNASALDIPGPCYFPFIGCMYLFRFCPSPHRILSWLTRIYGNVYSMNIGGSNVVIVNSMETIKEVLYQKSRDFAGRPDLFSFSLWECTSPIMFKDYSSEYLQQKHKAKLSLQELMNHEDFIIATAQKAIESLHESFEVVALEKQPFNPDNTIRETLSDTVMDCLFGPCISRLFYHEARVVLEQASTMFVKTSYVGACNDFVSIMRYMSRKKCNSMKLYISQLNDFVRRVYQVHQGSLLHHSDHTSSLAYVLRTHSQSYRPCEQDNSLGSINEVDDVTIVSILCEILFSAYEKMSTSFSWCVARLAANPSLQRDIQEELIDADYLKDSTRLLTATINEVLRSSSVLPFCIPRRTTRQTTLNGYHIPQGTTVFLNLWSCCNDEKLFNSPQQFNPYRFVSNEKTTMPEEFQPCCCFSGGERKCLGDTLARKFLVSLSGGLLSKFHIELATPRRGKSLNGVYGWTLRPHQYTIYVQARKTGDEGVVE